MESDDFDYFSWIPFLYLFFDLFLLFFLLFFLEFHNLISFIMIHTFKLHFNKTRFFHVLILQISELLFSFSLSGHILLIFLAPWRPFLDSPRYLFATAGYFREDSKEVDAYDRDDEAGETPADLVSETSVADIVSQGHHQVEVERGSYFVEDTHSLISSWFHRMGGKCQWLDNYRYRE